VPAVRRIRHQQTSTLSAALNPPSLAETINAKGFSHTAGFRIIAVEPEVAMARRDDLVQFFGHFHGGVITALADQAAGIAVTSGLPAGRIGVTVETKVNFLSPADGSELVARARTLKMSGCFRNPLRIRHRHHARSRSASRVPMTNAPTSSARCETDRAKGPITDFREASVRPSYKIVA
jgi:uncharacterized protein (TIGR00369 family)